VLDVKLLGDGITYVVGDGITQRRRRRGAEGALPPPIQMYSGTEIIRAVKLGEDLFFRDHPNPI